jgi:hypothetical protein
VAAIDRLNSWARSASYRRGHGGGREAVYTLKREALLEAHRRGELAWRWVEARVKCRDCGGAGLYIDQYGCKHDHCWACSNTGTARLEFAESTICGTVWHSPANDFPFRGGNPVFGDAGDWAPNLPGRDLEPWEAARDLNVAETFFPPRCSEARYGGGMDSCWGYKLHVGRLTDRCQLCGAEPGEGLNHGCSRGVITWTAAACQTCRDSYPRDASIFGAFPFPSELASHPEIVAWRERHERWALSVRKADYDRW